MRVDPAQHGADASGLLATLGAGDLIDHNASPDRRRLIGLVIPEAESVDAVVREPKAALMRMVRGLPFDDFHRKVARNDLPRSRTQRVQIRLHRLAAPENEIGERFAIDLDAKPVRFRNHLDLGGGQSC